MTAGTVDKWSEVQYLGLEFEHGNKDELKKQAIAKACDNADERKKLYEQKLGLKLVPKAFFERVATPVAPYVTGTYFGGVNGTTGMGGTAPSTSSQSVAAAEDGSTRFRIEGPAVSVR